jgi:hypothetical protein
MFDIVVSTLSFPILHLSFGCIYFIIYNMLSTFTPDTQADGSVMWVEILEGQGLDN